MTISGNIGKDPTTRQVGSSQVADFTVAVRQNRPDRNGDYGVDWVRCSVFGKRADTIMKYFHKGDNVAVSGQWSVNQWTNQQGEPQFAVELNVNDFDLPQRPKQQRANNQSSQRSHDPFANSGDSIDITDDDLPFWFGVIRCLANSKVSRAMN